MGYSPWCLKDSDTTEQLILSLSLQKRMQMLVTFKLLINLLIFAKRNPIKIRQKVMEFIIYGAEWEPGAGEGNFLCTC